jgi:hypothetical protein
VKGPLYRVHRADHDPLFFGRTGNNRFDDPANAFGVLYAGLSEACAFIETFGDPEFPVIEASLLATRKLSRMVLARPLRLANLRGSDLRRIGADARLCTGEHAIAQAWSSAIHAHPSELDGICYVSRRDPSQASVAVFDRAAPAVRAEVAADVLGAPRCRRILEKLLSRYELALGDEEP